MYLVRFLLTAHTSVNGKKVEATLIEVLRIFDLQNNYNEVELALITIDATQYLNRFKEEAFDDACLLLLGANRTADVDTLKRLGLKDGHALKLFHLCETCTHSSLR